MIRTTVLFLLCASFGAGAATTGAPADWEVSVTDGLAAVQPDADWRLASVDPEPTGAAPGFTLVIQVSRDGAATATKTRTSDITLKRGLVALSDDGTQGLMPVLAHEIDVRGWGGGAQPLAGIEPDEIDFHGSGPWEGIEPDEIDFHGSGPWEGIEPDEIDSRFYAGDGDALDLRLLAEAYPAYLVVDVVVGRDGSVSYDATDVIVGLGAL